MLEKISTAVRGVREKKKDVVVTGSQDTVISDKEKDIETVRY